MTRCKYIFWSGYKVNRVPFRIVFIWKSIRESIKERTSFWMIQFPLLGEKPHCSPTWLWVTNPICTPPCAFNTQRSSKLEDLTLISGFTAPELDFCFLMTPCNNYLHTQSSLSFLHIVSLSCLFFCSPCHPFSPVAAPGFLEDCTDCGAAVVNWKTVRGLH